MRIKIDALDTLFFKDGKPFNMGDETWADGMFPPPQSVIAGALRTAYFGYHPEDLPKANGPDDPTTGLKIRATALMTGETVYYHAPLDMVVDKSQTEKKKARLEPLELTEPSGLTSSPLKKVLSFSRDGKIDTAQGLLIDAGSLSSWLNGRKGKMPFLRLSELVTTEAKTGIGRENSTRSVAEGKLYRVGMKRPVSAEGFVESKLSIVVDFTGFDLPSAGFLKLGGEGKVASWKEFDQDLIPPRPELPSGDGELIIKLYLLTPGVFPEGALPTLPAGTGAEVIAASTGKALYFGGYDMKAGEPKPMKLAVPPGSVYYIKCSRQAASTIVGLHGTSLSGSDHASQGYGIVLTGVTNA